VGLPESGPRRGRFGGKRKLAPAVSLLKIFDIALSHVQLRQTFLTQEPQMSFREKWAWVMGALVLAAGLYYLNAALTVSREIGSTASPVAIFIPFTLLIVVASVAARVMFAILAPKEANAPADERERPAVDRAGNWSGLVLGMGAVTSLIYFFSHEDGFLLFHTIMGSLILSLVAEYAFQIMLFRRNI